MASRPELCGGSLFLTAAWESQQVLPWEVQHLPDWPALGHMPSMRGPAPECTHAQLSPAKPRPRQQLTSKKPLRLWNSKLSFQSDSGTRPSQSLRQGVGPEANHEQNFGSKEKGSPSWRGLWLLGHGPKDSTGSEGPADGWPSSVRV